MVRKTKPFSTCEYRTKQLQAGYPTNRTPEQRRTEYLENTEKRILQLKRTSYAPADDEDWKKLTCRTPEELKKVKSAQPGELKDFPIKAVNTELRGRRGVRQARRGALLGADRAST